MSIAISPALLAQRVAQPQRSLAAVQKAMISLASMPDVDSSDKRSVDGSFGRPKDHPSPRDLRD
jgi:hypothetical protein